MTTTVENNNFRYNSSHPKNNPGNDPIHMRKRLVCKDYSFSYPFIYLFTCLLIVQGIARTQSPLRKNYALESPAFGVIAGVSQTGVQW